MDTFDFTIIVHGSEQKCDQIRMSMEVVTPPDSEVIMGAGCFIPEGESHEISQAFIYYHLRTVYKRLDNVRFLLE